MSAKIALAEGDVLYSSTGLVAQISSRAPVRMVQEVGYAMLTGNVRTYLDTTESDTEVTNRMAQIEMGCLNNGFMLGVEFESEDKPLSCNTAGNKKIYKSGTWSGSIETAQIDPVLMALWTGGTLREPSATTPLRLIVTETLTSSATSVVTLTNTPITIIEAKRNTDDELHYEDDSSSDTNKTFVLDATAKTLTFEDVTANQSVSFDVTYRYESTTASDGLVITSSLSNFPGTFDGWMSFLAVAQDDNAVGRIIAEFSKASINSRFELGGQGIREHMSKAIEFTLEEAPTFYWEEFAVS